MTCCQNDRASRRLSLLPVGPSQVKKVIENRFPAVAIWAAWFSLVYELMRRFLLIVGTFLVGLSACKKDEPSQLQVYIAEKDARPGLHRANFSGFADLGYIPDKP